MTLYPGIKSGGGNVEMAVESALGTPGTYYDFRVCEDSDPAFPTDTREVKPVSAKGHWDPSVREAQLSYKKALEGAGTISTYITGSSSVATPAQPQCVSLFHSMGCEVVVGANQNDTVGAYTSTVAWTGSATSAELVAGCAGMIEGVSSNGVYWPFLCQSNSGSAAYNQVPTMAIAYAADGDSKIHKMWTITPPKGVQVDTDKTLAFRISDYWVTGATTGSAFVYTGCAVSEVKPIVFESGSPLKMESTVHIADRAFDQTGVDLTSAVYTDSVNIPIIDGASRFLMGFCDLSTLPIAATRSTGFRKATFNPGIKTIPVKETGTTTAVNGVGGYIGVYTGATLELVMDVNKEYWTHLEASGSQTAKYVELVQPNTAITNTALGLWLPNCFMVGKPVADLWSDKEMTVTVTLEPSSAGITTTSKTAQGNQPWYLAVSPVY
jgi:hypothetical protein